MKSYSSSIFLAAFLAVAPLASRDLLVAAHGYVNDITIGGRKYSGPQLRQGFRGPGSSAVRQVEDAAPVKINSAAMACGLNAGPATEIADANAGDEVLFNWGAAWPHRVGPILTYMASCGETPCNQFDASQAQWFKIGEQSFKPGTREWYQADLASGRPASARIPSNLAPGNYLIRNEVIALHIAATLGGAEVFPSCTQLRVAGSGNARPREDELVGFPGAYAQEDPGLWVKDIYEPNFNYVFPGPKVASLVDGGSGGAPAPAPSPGPAPATPPKEDEKPDIPVGPINAAPIPNTSVTPPPPAAAPTTPTTVPAPKPSTIRRCKNHKTAAQRAEKRRLAAEAAAASLTAAPSASSSSPVVKLAAAPTPDAALGKRSHVVGSYARRHHGKAMRRMHSH